MRATPHRYAAPGWGAGELWVEADRVVEHVFTVERGGGFSTGSDPVRKRARNSADFVSNLVVEQHEASAQRSVAVLTGSDPVRKRAPNSADFVSEVIARVRGFLAGEAVELADVPLDLDWCTPFQRAVVDVLRSVPRGELVTYGELAALAGAPGAARAAGTVCAQNRFWLFVPCHRVVAAGGIGGYGASGVELKRRLLRLEGHGSFS